MKRPATACAAVLLAACTPPDPKAELELLGLETYWAVDAPKGSEQYIAATVRFDLRNKGGKPLGSIEASAGFRRANDSGVFEEWGGDWKQVSSSREPLRPGDQRVVVLKSDARYHSPGPPSSMFSHPQFRDPKVELYVRVGSSGWVKFGEAAVERRIGSRSVPEELRDSAPR